MSDDDTAPADKLEEVNALLAEWTARSAGDSDRLLRRLEEMGYDVAGKSEDEIAEVLRKPPEKPPAKPAST